MKSILPTTAASGAPSRRPLPVPADFDPAANLLAREVDGRIFHTPLNSVRFCEQLMANGTPEDVALVERMIPGILAAQITDRAHPHHGAFKWELEMEAVEDLNSVEFLLYSLIPIMIEHGGKLQPATQAAVREAIRLGLIAVRRVDVSLEYTNIALKDITNSCLGGELLGDAATARRGADKLCRWIEFTDRSGGPYEFNSVPYTAVAIRVLSTLRRLTKNDATRTQANVAVARLALTAGLHLHLPTGRWAGPHSRAYHGTVIGRGGAYLMSEREAETYAEWIDNGVIPPWTRALLQPPTGTDHVVETTGRDRGLQTMTYLTPDFAFGVASRNADNQRNRYIAWQSNVFTLHYARPGRDDAGSVFTRYLLDDHWLGHFSPGPGRPTSGLLPDVGSFQGVQDGERAIGLYAPADLGATEAHSGAKAVVAVPRWSDTQDEAWVGEQRIASLPHTVPPGETIVLATGGVLLAIRPLELTNLGTGDQIFLRKIDDTLVVELVNYRGPSKTFWEVTWPGAFFQGMPRCGFYAEVAARSAYPTAGAFANLVARGRLLDVAAAPVTFTGTEQRPWRVSYARDGRELGIEVDLMRWAQPPRRWTHAGELGWPMLESGRARETRSGEVRVRDCILKTSVAEPAWLYAAADGSVVTAAYHGPTAARVELATRMGSVVLDQVEMAIVTLTRDDCAVDAIGLIGPPRITRR